MNKTYNVISLIPWSIQTQWQLKDSLELLLVALTAPMAGGNAIVVTAYKKYVLVSLIHTGEPSLPYVRMYICTEMLR